MIVWKSGMITESKITAIFCIADDFCKYNGNIWECQILGAQSAKDYALGRIYGAPLFDFEKRKSPTFSELGIGSVIPKGQNTYVSLCVIWRIKTDYQHITLLSYLSLIVRKRLSFSLLHHFLHHFLIY